MMVTDRRSLIKYLPLYMQEYAEIRQILSADQDAIDATWDSVDSIWDNQFIEYASEVGVKRWEKMLNITPKATDTLPERRFRVMTKLQSDTPYTFLKLNEKLTTLCGEGGYSIYLVPNDYYIEIKLGLGNKNMLDDVDQILKEMIPANMLKNITIMYNTHAVLSEFTHSTLHGYTHEELRNEVIVDV